MFRSMCYLPHVMHVCSLIPVMSNSLLLYGLQPIRLFCPWDSLGKNSVAGCHFLLHGIFLTQASNLCLLHLLHWQACIHLRFYLFSHKFIQHFQGMKMENFQVPYLVLSYFAKLETIRNFLNPLNRKSLIFKIKIMILSHSFVWTIQLKHSPTHPAQKLACGKH